jgi:hypothetical protein
MRMAGYSSKTFQVEYYPVHPVSAMGRPSLGKTLAKEHAVSGRDLTGCGKTLTEKHEV